MSNKIIRSICLFRNQFESKDLERIEQICQRALSNGFQIQTRRICSPELNFPKFEQSVNNGSMLLNAGTLNFQQTLECLNNFYQTKNINFNLDLTKEKIGSEHLNVLLEIIKNKPGHTFKFAYTFNNPDSSPYFPSAKYKKDGFSIGLQPTDLAEGCNTLDEWLQNMKVVWNEIFELYKDEPDFLGLDTSIAPIFKGSGSMIDFIRKIKGDFSRSATTDIYMQITKFIKEENPKLTGLSGIMFPALEDFLLAEEYEAGNFSIERNIYLSLHSGLGIDTYPIGIDENPEKVLDILKTVQGLSNKYSKPLSVRFVSDGKAKIGDKTDFQNQYLMDVVVRAF